MKKTPGNIHPHRLRVGSAMNKTANEIRAILAELEEELSDELEMVAELRDKIEVWEAQLFILEQQTAPAEPSELDKLKAKLR